MDRTDSEREFLAEARGLIRASARSRREASLHDKIHAVARSGDGACYEGMAFETSLAQFDVCAERHALANMHHAETEHATLDAILVAGPVPDVDGEPTTPCGACRHAIHDIAPDATVICTNFVRADDGWTMFPTVDRYTATELYPGRTDPPSWE